MKTIAVLSLALMILTQSLLLAQIENENAVVEEIAIESQVEFVLTKRGPGIFYAMADLGNLVPGKTYRLKFHVKNSLPETFTFKSVVANCACSSVRIPQAVLKTDESVKGEVIFKVSENISKPRFQFDLKFFDDPLGTPTASIDFGGDISGLFFLDNHANPLEVRGKIGIWRIPLRITEPVKMENLKLKVSDELNDLQSCLKQESGTVFLELGIAKEALGPNGVAGEFLIVDLISKRELKSYIRIVAEKPVKLSPLELRFRSHDDGSLIAAGLISIKKEKLADGKQEEIRSLKVSCELKDALIVRSATLGTSGVIQWTVVVSSDMEAEFKSKYKDDNFCKSLKWEVETNVATYQFPIVSITLPQPNEELK